VFTPTPPPNAPAAKQPVVQAAQAVRSIDAAVESLYKGKKKSAAR
jgi:hypothetical protein